MTTAVKDTHRADCPRERPVRQVSFGAATMLVREGAYANIFIVLTGGAFLTGLALFLGANDLQIGVLAAAPFLMQSAQLLSPFVFRDSGRSRGRMISMLGTSRIIWITAVPLVLFSGDWRLSVLLSIVAVSGLLTMIATPTWLDWMADIVPKELRGRFFSRRNAAIAGTTLAGTILGSLILDWGRSEDVEAFGFVAIVLLATIGALMAWREMKRILANDRVGGDANRAVRPNLTKPFRNGVFRQVLAAFALWNIAIGSSAAFFAPHMLLNLNMSFFQVGLYSCATALVGILSSRVWGRFIDRIGSKPVLNICAFGIALIPLIWLFPTEHSLWILIPEAIYSGLLWAGFNVAAFTLPLDRSPREDRTTYLSVFAAITGLAFFTASVIAGTAAETLSDWRGHFSGLTLVNYHLLFVGSSMLRLLTAGLIAYFHEPSELRLPMVIQIMGYAVLKRMSIGRQVFPFAADASSANDKPGGSPG